MRIKSFTLCALFVGLLGFTACNKDSDMVFATIVDTKDITNLGCGYLLQLEDNSLVKPDYLPSHYQHGTMKVKVKFEFTGITDTCRYGTILYDRARIIDIKKINDR